MLKLNARQEHFAQGVARGMSLIAAYRAAGYKPSTSRATIQGHLPHVRKRIAELLKRAARKTIVTIEKLTEELEAARVLSMSDEKGAAAAVAAIMAKAKLHGLDVNRHKIEGGIHVTISSDDDRL
jgi:phosphopantetheinyl transferase (holo-ACP synthase)